MSPTASSDLPSTSETHDILRIVSRLDLLQPAQVTPIDALNRGTEQRVVPVERRIVECLSVLVGDIDHVLDTS